MSEKLPTAASQAHPELDTSQPLRRKKRLLKHYGNVLIFLLSVLAFFAVRWFIRTYITKRAGGYDDGTLNAYVLATLSFFYNAAQAWLAFKISWPRLYRWIRSCAEQELLDFKYGYYDTTNPRSTPLVARIALEYRKANFYTLCFKFCASLAIYGFYFYLLHHFTLGALGLIPHEGAGILLR